HDCRLAGDSIEVSRAGYPSNAGNTIARMTRPATMAKASFARVLMPVAALFLAAIRMTAIPRAAEMG
ncbi:MAG: hypothetical protein ACHQ7M_17105, partial [Chloroflexota bacterium]